MIHSHNEPSPTARINDKVIGDGEPAFIVFEAGATHEGVDSAKLLIDHAADAGADAVKFQILDPDRLIADRTQRFQFNILKNRETGEQEEISEPLYDILKRRSLTHDEWRIVKAHADSRKIAFFATIAFDDQIEFVKTLGCQSVKIASADVNYFQLLRCAARAGVCVQVDTGNSTLGEIERAIDVVLEAGGVDIIVHHCPSGYPARLDKVNLNIITTLKQMFRIPVGFSDHSPSLEMDIAAIALGANLVEKTITFDRMTPRVEHIMSLEPDQMKRFVRTIRDVETALGSSRRIFTAEERTRSLAVRRSAYVAGAVPEGTRLADAPIMFRRPGFGLRPDQVEAMADWVFTRDYEPGERVAFTDLRAG
jgi:sialic acid synthase SpsE